MKFSNTAVVIALGLFFFGVGVVALGWPHKIQEYALTFYADAKGLAKWNPFVKWMQTSSYIVSLRIVGSLALLAAFFALYVLFRKL